MPEEQHLDTWKKWLSGIQGRRKITLKQMFLATFDVFHHNGFVAKRFGRWLCWCHQVMKPGLFGQSDGANPHLALLCDIS
jgi:hypothetical protein